MQQIIGFNYKLYQAINEINFKVYNLYQSYNRLETATFSTEIAACLSIP